MGINKGLINKVLLVIISLFFILLCISAFIGGMKYAHDETVIGRQLIDMIGGYLLK